MAISSWQAFVIFSTIIIFIPTLILAFYLTREYLSRKSPSLFYWSLGMWSFVVAVFLEIFFAFGLYSAFLMAAYWFLVAVLVELLALGSIQLVKSKLLKNAFYIYTIAVTLFTIYSLYASEIENAVQQYVVLGQPPELVTLASELAVFPATFVLLGVAIKGYIQTRRKSLLSIILGVFIVGLAGTLYIVEFPIFLYYSEFVGILFLWYGFYSKK